MTARPSRDPKVFQTCVGGNEGLHQIGEGPCNPNTGECGKATTQNGAACPSNNFASGFNCEFSDANCMPAGSRTASLNGNPVTYTWPIAGCIDNVFQNGDLDFDGTSYQADWPDGSSGHPSSFQYIGPFSNGQAYPKIQFQTNVGASEILCDTETGAGCTALPAGAAFYPFWSLGSVDTSSAHSLPAVANGGLGGVLRVELRQRDPEPDPEGVRQDRAVRHAEHGTVRRDAHQRRAAQPATEHALLIGSSALRH